MVQAIGAVLMLAGAMAWHVASSGTEIHNINDVWNDFLKTMRGEHIG